MVKNLGSGSVSRSFNYEKKKNRKGYKEWLTEYNKQRNLKRKKKVNNRCKDCNLLISPDATRCKKCSIINNRKVFLKSNGR